MNIQEYLIVNINGKEWVGLNVGQVGEAMTLPELSHYPGQNLPAKGFFSLRGEIISVYSLASLLNVPSSDENTVIITHNEDESKIGLSVHGIHGVMNIDESMLRDSKNLTDNPYVENVIFRENKVISLISLKKFGNVVTH